LPSRRSLILSVTLLIGGVILGALATGGTADLAPATSEPADPELVPTRPATSAEVAAAQLKGVTPEASKGKLTLRARISEDPITTRPNASNYVGLKCPQGFVAISGGALTGFRDLVISQSAPLYPGREGNFGKYTPRQWWVSVTNLGDALGGSGDPLQWTPLVNCLNKTTVSGRH
jgi:hypothetical protein